MQIFSKNRKNRQIFRIFGFQKIGNFIIFVKFIFIFKKLEFLTIFGKFSRKNWEKKQNLILEKSEKNRYFFQILT